MAGSVQDKLYSEKLIASIAISGNYKYCINLLKAGCDKFITKLVT